MLSRPSAAVLLWAVLLPGCLVAPPRQSVRGEWGLVRAESVIQGQRVASILDELAPQVRELLPDTRQAPVEVWVQRELAIYSHWEVDENVPAFTVEADRRIHLLETGARDTSAALGHELVHALLGPSWDVLPPVAEEGLADWAQERLHPELAASMRADHLSKAAAAFDGLDLGLWCRLPGEDSSRQVALFTFLSRPDGVAPLGAPSLALEQGDRRGASFFEPYQVSVRDPRLYGLGYLVVCRIIERGGVAALHDLCMRAKAQGLEQVPAEWLLVRAELDDDPRTWRAAVLERFGRTEVLALGHTLVPFLVELVADEIRPRVSARSAEEFLSRYRPRFGPNGADVTVPLWGLPDLHQRLRRAWPAHGTQRPVLASAR